MNEFFLVLSDVVLNKTGTGYKGVYRTPPWNLLDMDRELGRWKAIVDQVPENEHGVFSSYKDAVDAAMIMEAQHLEGHLVRCVLIDEQAQQVMQEPGFLGFDVAQPFSGFCSAIVDWFANDWGQGTAGARKHNPVLNSLAVWFERRLNEHRLFRSVCEADLFLSVNQECSVALGLETDTDLRIIGIVESTLQTPILGEPTT